MKQYEDQRAIVVGGSIGGLTTALLLKQLGFTVDIYERTPDNLDGRGGGIVLQPATLRWFRECSSQHPEDVSTATRWVQYLDQSNQVITRDEKAWRYTSWGTFYRALLADFGDEGYHLGEFVCGFDQDADGVDLRFVSGKTARADLVVLADGIGSLNRKRIDPEADLTYSGYIGWRGTVPESELSPDTFTLLSDSLTYSVAPLSHINLYPIPAENGQLDPGNRLINYVWYRNVQPGADFDEFMTDKRGFLGKVSVIPGQVQDRYVDDMRQAAVDMLAPAAAEVVTKTKQPFIQAIWDLRTKHMVKGRVALLGDAATAARPHAAAGTAKAAVNAWALHDALIAARGDITAALEAWEPEQLELGNQVVDRVTAMGRRSQVDSTWTPGDPDLRFGLYGPGR
ncbi:MAG: 2,6-dihydroxypyridine hydroxylase [Homoserinimonas sp.]|jgi:2,6-dihydroxypyridine 3-monooxygenase|nr:2,6-dihydroxypyridine hydroxylase [Homoserinimonas sp.]